MRNGARPWRKRVMVRAWGKEDRKGNETAGRTGTCSVGLGCGLGGTWDRPLAEVPVATTRQLLREVHD